MDGTYKDIGNPNDMHFLDPSGQYNATMQNYGNIANSLLGRIDNMSQNPFSYTSQYNPQAYQSTYDPEAYMRAFLGRADALSNLVSGQNSQLQQSLNAIAQQQAAQGGEAALANMPGLRNSGAAMAAYGNAYANPFAAAQAQLQQNQLQGTLGLWNQAMGNYADAYRTLEQARLGAYNTNNANQQFLENLRFNAALQNNQNQQNYANAYANLASNLFGLQSGMLQNQSGWYTPTYTYEPGPWEQFGNIFTNVVMPAAATAVGVASGNPMIAASGLQGFNKNTRTQPGTVPPPYMNRQNWQT